MEVNQLKQWNLAQKISDNKCENISTEILEDIKNPSIKIASYNLAKCEYDNFKISIIDFEGSPVFMCGILIHGKIITFYIENYKSRSTLYITILELIKKIENYILYAFSDHERFELINIYRYLGVQGYNTSQLSFIETFPIINLQKVQYESLAEAIFSLCTNMTASTTGDPLLRNSKLVDSLYATQQYQEIILHNRNCLINEYTLFQKRWLKNYTL